MNLKKRGQETGLTWLIWVVVGIVAVVLIIFFLTGGFGTLQGAIELTADESSALAELCGPYADAGSETAWCTIKKLNDRGLYGNCDESKIRSQLREKITNRPFDCPGLEEDKADLCDEFSNTEKSKIFVDVGNGKKDCNDLAA